MWDNFWVLQTLMLLTIQNWISYISSRTNKFSSPLYRVNALRNLSQLFPNLTLIRGHKLFINYALVAFEMMHLQEIGLTSLTAIMRGSVRFEKNPGLCYVDTIDWNLIARAAKDEHVISVISFPQASLLYTYKRSNFLTSDIVFDAKSRGKKFARAKSSVWMWMRKRTKEQKKLGRGWGEICYARVSQNSAGSRQKKLKWR